MKSNNLFTYLLYALLGVLILAAIYLGLERRKANELRADEERREREEVERMMRETGIIDTAEVGGSSYAGEKTTGTNASKTGATTTPKTTKDGIEIETPTTATKTPTTATKTPATTTKTTVTPPPANDSKKLVSKGGTTTTTRKSVSTASTGRYMVVVGAFSQVANARTEMERFVKMGYRDAEVVKHTGNLWRVLAKRTNNRAEAERIEGDLERHGIDAQMIDSYKK